MREVLDALPYCCEDELLTVLSESPEVNRETNRVKCSINGA